MQIHDLMVPYDSGRYSERMGRGPAHLFQTIEPLLRDAGHTVRAEEVIVADPFPAEIKTTFALCRSVAERVRDCLRQGSFPLVLSGNCNVAAGTISGCGSENTDVIWFDAHGEATTPETTTSGFLDGMGISILTGRCWQNLARTIPGFKPLSGDRFYMAPAIWRPLRRCSWTTWESAVRRVLGMSSPGHSSPQAAMAPTCISTWTCLTPWRQ